MQDTTHIFLVDTAYVRSIAEQLSSKGIWNTVVIIIAPIITGIFILWANRMTLKRVKIDTFYQSRLTAHLQWESKLRDAAINFVATIHDTLHLLLSEKTQESIEIGLAEKSLQEYILRTGEDSTKVDTDPFFKPVKDKMSQLHIEIRDQFAKENLVSATFRFLLDPNGTFYKEIRAEGQKAIQIEIESRSHEKLSLEVYGELISQKQTELSVIYTTIEKLLNVHIASVRNHLEQSAQTGFKQ